MNLYKILFFLFISNILSSLAWASELPYDVQWLSEGVVIKNNGPSRDVYCYSGSTKSLLNLLQTVKCEIKVKGEFKTYIAETPEDAVKKYNEDNYGWSILTLNTQNIIMLNPYNITCMCVRTKLPHHILVDVKRIDFWRLLPLTVGIILILSSRILCGNPLFFYLCGIVLGVCTSILLVFYYFTRLVPGQKSIIYSLLLGGSTVGIFLLQQLYNNTSSLFYEYRVYWFWYISVAAFISFVVCYRIGPPKDQRSKNLVMWTLQAVGSLSIFYSSDYQEACASIIILCLTIKYFPKYLTNEIYAYWRRKFPPKPRFITNEEYYEEGARETLHGLDALRKYAASPDCAQWNIMLKLNDSQRFAKFVSGESHLNDDEVLSYEEYRYMLDRSDGCLNRSTKPKNDIEISTDDSSDSESEEDF